MYSDVVLWLQRMKEKFQGEGDMCANAEVQRLFCLTQATNFGSGNETLVNTILVSDFPTPRQIHLYNRVGENSEWSHARSVTKHFQYRTGDLGFRSDLPP